MNASQPSVETPTEKHQRFQRLHLLLDDPKRRQRLLFVLSLVSFAIVSLLGFLTERISVLPIDLATTRELQEVTSQPFLQMMVFVSQFGYMPWGAITIVTGVIAISLLLRWKDGAYLLALTAIEGLTNTLIKIGIGRPRPLDTLVNVFIPVSGNSFPSGHVMFYTVFFGFLFFLIWTQIPHSIWRTLALIFTSALIMLIGPSRMYLGAHWLSDVIAAHLLGLIILAFGIEFYMRWIAPSHPIHKTGLGGAGDQALEEQQ